MLVPSNISNNDDCIGYTYDLCFGTARLEQRNNINKKINTCVLISMKYTIQKCSKFRNSALTHDDNNARNAMLGDVMK